MFIWSTGFVIARGISGLIDPYLFLLVRFACVIAIFGVAMGIMRLPPPGRNQLWRLLATGAVNQTDIDRLLLLDHPAEIAEAINSA